MKILELLNNNKEATHVATDEIHADNINKKLNDPISAIFDPGDHFIFKSQDKDFVIFNCIDYRPDLAFKVSLDIWKTNTVKI